MKEITIAIISILLIFVPWMILAKMVVMNGFVENITVKVPTEMYLRLVIWQMKPIIGASVRRAINDGLTPFKSDISRAPIKCESTSWDTHIGIILKKTKFRMPGS